MRTHICASMSVRICLPSSAQKYMHTYIRTKLINLYHTPLRVHVSEKSFPVLIHTHTEIHAYIHIHTQIYVHTPLRVHVSENTFPLLIHTHRTDTYTQNLYIHTEIYAYIHKYTHTHKSVCTHLCASMSARIRLPSSDSLCIRFPSISACVCTCMYVSI